MKKHAQPKQNETEVRYGLRRAIAHGSRGTFVAAITLYDVDASQMVLIAPLAGLLQASIGCTWEYMAMDRRIGRTLHAARQRLRLHSGPRG